MEKLRNTIHAHISKPILFLLIGLSLTGLGLLAQSFLLSSEATLANFEAELVAPSMQASVSSAEVLGDSTTEIIPPPSLEVPNRTLTLGEESSDVVLLQEFLRWRGFWPGGEKISGYFGEVTKEAVIAYQTFHNIEAEGIVGPTTRDFWLEDLVSFERIAS
jgi:murein L,D-transpeptidase YcbB/YkuD